MRLKLWQAILVCAPLLSSSGCGYVFGDKGVFRDRSEDYKQAVETAPITVPAGMDSVAMTEMYPIPPVQDKFVAEGKFEVPRPVPLSTTSGPEVVRIQKLGDQSWALVAVAPGQVWPQVRNFMAASGMQIAHVDAQAGILDSNWVTTAGQPLSSRYRFRIEQGVQRGTSELHVLQMQQQKSNADEWPAQSDDPEQAMQMLRSIAQFLADSAESAPVSLIAEQGINAAGKITLQQAPEGYTYLRLELPYDRAWASLGRALEKSSFAITDLDRSAGVYHARFQGVAAAKDQSWWASLWSSDDAKAMVDQVFLVSMQTLPDQAVAIRLRPQDEGIPFGKREEQELLVTIKGNID